MSILKKNWQIIGVLFLSFSAYVNIIWNNFVWDDLNFILRWPVIRNFDPALFMTGIVPQGHEGVYRPLRTFLYAASYKIAGINPVFYHSLSIFFHLSATFLVYLFINRLTRNNKLAIITSLLFGLHPIHTESVDFATASFDLPAVLFLFISLIFLMDSWGIKVNLWKYAVSILTAMLAYLSGESVLVLPLLVLVLIRILKPEDTLKKYLWSAPYFFMLGGYFILRFAVYNLAVRASPFGQNISLLWVLMLKAWWLYIQLLFLPINLQVIHQVIADTVNNTFFLSYIDLPAIVGILIIIGLFWGILFFRRRHPIISFSFLWFVLTMLPFSNLYPSNTSVAERYLYLPSLAFCLAVVYSGRAFYRRLILKYPVVEIKKICIFLLIAVCSFYFIRTQIRNSDWKNSIVLWEKAVQDTPGSSLAFNNLAKAYSFAGDNSKAEDAFQSSIRINPGQSLVYNNLGQIKMFEGKYDQALELTQKAVDLKPGDINYMVNLAEANMKTGNLDEAEKLLNETVLIRQNAVSLDSLGMLSLIKKEPDKAKDYFRAAIFSDPLNTTSYNNLAVILLSQGKYNDALDLLKISLSVFPEDPEVYFNLAGAYKALGNENLSKESLDKALTLRPNFPEAVKMLDE